MGHLEGSLGEYVRPVDGIDCEKWRIDIVRVDHLKELAWRKMSNKRDHIPEDGMILYEGLPPQEALGCDRRGKRLCT